MQDVEEFGAKEVIASSLSPQTDLPKLKWADVLSNYSAQSAPITINSNIQVLTWNLTTKVANIPVLNRAESDDEYKERLTRMAHKLADQMNNNRVGLAALQEVPADKVLRDHFLGELKKKLNNPPHWNLDEPQAYSQVEGTPFGLLTLVNNQWLTPTNKPEDVKDNPRLLVTDVTFKKTTPAPNSIAPKDMKIRFVNAHFAAPSNPAAADLAKLKASFSGQVLFAGHFDQELDKLGFSMHANKASSYFIEKDGRITGKKVDGFAFKEDPGSYNLTTPSKPSPIETTVNTTENFTKQIKLADLVEKFTKPGVSAVERKGNDIVIIKNLKKPEETVEIKKTTEDKLQFKASRSSDTIIDMLIESIKTCLPEKSTIKINVQGGGTPEEIKALKEKIG